MGRLLRDSGQNIHAEARRKSFVLYTDFGEKRIELDWDQLDETHRLVCDLKEYAAANRLETHPTKHLGEGI